MSEPENDDKDPKTILDAKAWDYGNSIAAMIPAHFDIAQYQTSRELITGLGQSGILEPLRRLVRYADEYDIDLMLSIVRVIVGRPVAPLPYQPVFHMTDEEWARMFEPPWPS